RGSRRRSVLRSRRARAVARPLPAYDETSPLTRVVDLVHTVEHGLVTYPGLLAPVICDYWSRDDHDFQIAKIEGVAIPSPRLWTLLSRLVWRNGRSSP